VASARPLTKIANTATKAAALAQPMARENAGRRYRRSRIDCSPSASRRALHGAAGAETAANATRPVSRAAGGRLERAHHCRRARFRPDCRNCAVPHLSGSGYPAGADGDLAHVDGDHGDTETPLAGPTQLTAGAGQIARCVQAGSVWPGCCTGKPQRCHAAPDPGRLRHRGLAARSGHPRHAPIAAERLGSGDHGGRSRPDGGNAQRAYQEGTR